MNGKSLDVNNSIEILIIEIYEIQKQIRTEKYQKTNFSECH